MSPRALREVAIVLLGFTSVFAILSGIGTSCVAWGAANYEPFASLAPYGWLFQLLVLVNVAVGGVGVVITLALMRRKRAAYIGSVAALVVFLLTAVIQMYYSSSLRGVSFFSTPPTNIRFYITSAVLFYFLALRIAPLWRLAGMVPAPRVAPSQKGVLGTFLLVTGIAVISTPIWAGASHMIGGYNFVDVLLLPLSLSGGLLVVGGIGILGRTTLAYISHLSQIGRRGRGLANRLRIREAVKSLLRGQ